MKYFNSLMQLQIILLIIYQVQCYYLNNEQPVNSEISTSSDSNSTTDQNEDEDVPKKVRMTVFYETLCPDSMNFFTEQITVLFDNTTNLYQYVTFDFVPYGKAEQTYDEETDQYTFTCQHGELECKYNKLHACIVNTVSAAKEYSDIDRFVPFLTCLMGTKNEDRILARCANKYDIPVDAINHCRNGKLGDKLLAKFGNRTHKFEPKIKFIPTIVFNGKFKEADFQTALTNLRKVICKYITPKPNVCNSTAV